MVPQRATSDERARIALDVHPAGQGIAGPSDGGAGCFGLRPAKSLSATGATWLISTGRNGNPTAPSGVADQDPAVDTLPSQARVTCSGLVIWLIGGSIRSPIQGVCQDAASSCRCRPRLPQ